MLTKAVCVAFVGYTYFFIVVPPKAGRNLSKTDDKLSQDSVIAKVHYYYATKVAPTTTIFLTAFYLYQLWQGKIPSDLKMWEAVATVVHLFVYRLRMDAYRELNRMFTYKIMIRSDHQLITTGPYKHLRHPSYTGYALGSICFNMLVIYGGLWDAVIYPWTGMYLSVSVALIVFGTYFGLFVVRRIHFEEAMLSEHFGSEWSEYASKTWRIIRFVY
ncbi:hypothetical protein BGZ99_001529 [Dissophora globulifera]|uniref:Protein-S-isoprenylcysteine O-methyltransferase n=1 Tax=Dissophora globulifera TaxID=979702 RepID=A0A9P6RUL8_9FUNG|nr:hypothetical protein BGZ99_001529 [Dissophora globulifera]